MLGTQAAPCRACASRGLAPGARWRSAETARWTELYLQRDLSGLARSKLRIRSFTRRRAELLPVHGHISRVGNIRSVFCRRTLHPDHHADSNGIMIRVEGSAAKDGSNVAAEPSTRIIMPILRVFRFQP